MGNSDTSLNGVKVVQPNVISDPRGFFIERWGYDPSDTVGSSKINQMIHTRSSQGVVRGLHFQYPRAQDKLVFAVRGTVLDVIVDIRRGSPQFGLYQSVELSDQSQTQVWIPQGYAHGFIVLSEFAELLYLISGNVYVPEEQGIVRWDDPEIGIEWPKMENYVISERDRNAPFLKDITGLPTYGD